MSTKKMNRNAAKKKHEEEKAEKVIKGIFIGLIILAVLTIVCFSVWG